MDTTLTINEVSKLLKVSRRTLNRKMGDGQIEFHKHPGQTGKVFFTEQQIINYINKYCKI